MALRSLTVGIDVGGTFTDLLAVDPRTNEVKLAKVPTTVDNQAIGFMAALAAAGADPAIVQAIVHGTTTTTNALLERKVARSGASPPRLPRRARAWPSHATATLWHAWHLRP
jgi:N-methylhydantoinase A